MNQGLGVTRRRKGKQQVTPIAKEEEAARLNEGRCGALSAGLEPAALHWRTLTATWTHLDRRPPHLCPAREMESETEGVRSPPPPHNDIHCPVAGPWTLSPVAPRSDPHIIPLT
uniref:Uncharacterized protein n=1 Tax=Knipowitschia caucasica TaxID=637954 RepID=A0AAV2MAB6_KNICA